jgi:hypothetical protein
MAQSAETFVQLSEEQEAKPSTLKLVLRKMWSLRLGVLGRIFNIMHRIHGPFLQLDRST